MRYFVVYLADDARVRYRLSVSGDLEGSFAWDRHLLTNIPLQSPLSLSGLKNVIRSNASVGDYVFWYPDLRIRTASVINGNRHFLSAFRAFRSRSHQHAIDSLLAHPLAASNPYPIFSDETLRFHTLPLESDSSHIQIDHQIEIADPWTRFAAGAGSVQTTSQQIQLADNSEFSRLANVWRNQIQTRQSRGQSNSNPAPDRQFYSGPFIFEESVAQTGPTPPSGYRNCANGEMIYWGYRFFSGLTSEWNIVTKEQIGRKVVRSRRIVAPDAPWPDWIRRYNHNHAYRYLELGEYVQEGDFALLGDGTLRPVGDLSIGTTVSSCAKDCFLRHVGRDGWRMLKEGTDNPQDGAFELTQCKARGAVSRGWINISIHHNVDFLVWDYRRLVTGYKKIWKPSPLATPLGYVWAEAGEYVFRAGTYLVHDNGTMLLLSNDMDYSWFYAPVGRRFLRVDPNWDWSSFQVRPGSFNLTVELLSFKCTGERFQDGTYWVLNRYGLMAIAASGRDGCINTRIGDFFPTTFKVNGQLRLIFCTDQVTPAGLADLLHSSLMNTVGGLQQLLPITVNQSYQQVSETLDRQVEL